MSSYVLNGQGYVTRNGDDDMVNFKNLSAGILCVVMACSILVGCGGAGGGGSSGGSSSTVENTLAKTVAADGKAFKFGDKDGKILAIETPKDFKQLKYFNSSLVWLKGAFYAVGNDDGAGLAKYMIKDKKIDIPKDNVITKDAVFLQGTDGTYMYYQDKDSKMHFVVDDKEGGISYDKSTGWFAPAPGGKKGLQYFNNQVVYDVTLDKGKYTEVGTKNLLTEKMNGPTRVYINGDAVFMEGGYDKTANETIYLIYEYKMDMSFVRKYGDMSIKEPGGLNGNFYMTAAKDYVVAFDVVKYVLNIYSRKDGKFIAAVNKDDLGIIGEIKSMVPVQDNLILAYDFDEGVSHFYLIQL